jgi:myosin heavy subunit
MVNGTALIGSPPVALTSDKTMALVLPVLDKGSEVAFNSPSHSWVLGRIEAFDAKTNVYTCSAKDPEPITCKVKNTSDEIFAPRAEYLEEDVHDLLQLTELHEASLLFCLKRRYLHDVVYTNIGPIVVALNPFTFDIPWYKDDKMQDYLSEGVVIERNLPHSWAVAHNTYWEMRENRYNQTILISGESGAGKTEGAKIVVKYVGVLSTLHGTTEQQEACALVNRKVNAASPILESFGNAKTVRNDNSSRFGKFMKLQFDKEGFLVGSHATKYLLEKSRIITASKDERVYHSFYQLAGGGENKKYHIKGAAVHKSVKSGDCVAIPGVDEAASFAEVKQAFADVGITEEEQNGIWRVCAGILFLQNVEFIEKEERNVRMAEVDKDWVTALERACELWMVNRGDLERELLRFTNVQRGETVVKHHDRAKAADTRDSVSKNIYSWLFDWIVSRINTTTDCESQCSLWIGLLDIFGFEDFETNYFEQLCINLANETLQNHYNFYIFTEDVRECEEEGIDTTLVTFADNKPCIDLLSSAKNSIFSLLDDECKIGSGTDLGFLNKILTAFQGTKTSPGHPFFLACAGKLKDSAFRIRHYAGDVTYMVQGFLEKNRDSLKETIKEILMRSQVPVIPGIVPPLEDASRPQAKTTVSNYFSRQLQDLMAVINSTNPHWIRCIKPHPAKKPKHFSNLNVIQQLRSAGVLATVKIRQGGYPIRFKKPLFLQRYRILIAKEDGSDDTSICRAIFERLGIEAATGQLGRTKVFLRQRAFLELNHAKDSATHVLALVFQRMCRGARERERLFRMYCKKNGERLLAEMKAREEHARRQREEAQRRRQAEEAEKLRREAAERARLLRVVIVCQKYVRGKLTRLAFARHFLDEFRATEEAESDERYGKWRVMADRPAQALRQLEQKELERHRKQQEFTRERSIFGGGGGKDINDDGTGGGDANGFETMLKRRDMLRQRREVRAARIEEKAKDREDAAERKAKAIRDRAKAQAAEDLKVKQAAEAQARAARSKQLKAKAESDELKLAAAAERRSAAVQKVEERRRAVAEEQLRVMAQEVVASAQLSFYGRPRDDGPFDRVRRDWAEQQQWEATREAVMYEAAERERRWTNNYHRKLELATQSAVARAPLHPA